MDAIILRFKADGLDDVTQGILNTVQKLRQMQSALDGVNRRLNTLSNSPAVAGLNKINSSAAGATSQIVKLNAQLAQLSTTIVPGLPGYGGTGGRGAGGRQPRPTVPKVPKPKPNPLTQALRQGIYSTRLNFGGASPLVGSLLKVAKAFGPEVEGAALVAAAAIGTAMFAGQHVNSRAGYNLVNGSRGGANLSGIAGALGFDPMGTSNNLQNAIQSGAGRSFALRAGINPMYNPYTGQGGDFASKTADYIRYYGDPSKSSDQQAAAAARAAGLENEIGQSRNASAGVRKFLHAKGFEFSERDKQDAANGLGTMNKNLAIMSDTIAKLGLRLLPELNKGLYVWAAALLVILKITDMITGHKDKGKSAADKMDQAANKMQSAADTLADGVYGLNGQRVKGLVPSGLNGSISNGDKAAASYYRQMGIPIA